MTITLYSLIVLFLFLHLFPLMCAEFRYLSLQLCMSIFPYSFVNFCFICFEVIIPFVLSSWWIDLFLYKLLLFISSNASYFKDCFDINIPTPAFWGSVFIWSIFFLYSFFQMSVLYFNWLCCKQYIVRFYFLNTVL